MPQSPSTPSRRRRSSGIGSPLTPTISQTGSNMQRRPHSRKSSAQSICSPTTPRPPSALDRRGSFSFPNEIADHATAGSGLGSLADELAEEEWDEDAEMEEYPGEEISQENGEMSSQYGHERDMGMSSLTPADALKETTNGSGTSTVNFKHRSKPSDYDGSDYGGSDDFDDVEGIPPSLEARMIAIENLARQGTGESKGPGLDVFGRVAEQLKELSSQVNVETNITRLSTAHAALTTHLTYQSRHISTLTSPLTSPLAAPPSPDVVEELGPLLEALLRSLPQPPPTVLPAIHALHLNTAELLATLSTLADTLHMTRQTTNAASRRLKGVKETVTAMKVELEEAEEGRRWLERGQWDEKLRKKDAAAVCRDVVRGFEAVCEDWRRRLLSGQRNGVKVSAG